MNPKITNKVRRLVALSFDEQGEVSPERVRAVLDTLAREYRVVAELRPLLRAYHAALRRRLARDEVRIECAGMAAPDTAARIAAHFTKFLGRAVKPVVSENPSLIAGVRVRSGDDVYEASVRGALDRLAADAGGHSAAS